MFVVESWAESHPYGPHDQTITTSAPSNMEAYGSYAAWNASDGLSVHRKSRPWMKLLGLSLA